VQFSNIIFSQTVFYNNYSGLYGIIDKNGNEILEPTYKYMSQFWKGVSIYEKDGKYGIINESGKIILKAEFEDKCSIAKTALYDDFFYLEIIDENEKTNTYYNKNIYFNISEDKNIDLSKIDDSIKQIISESRFFNGIDTITKSIYFHPFIGERGFNNGIAVIKKEEIKWDDLSTEYNFIDTLGNILSSKWFGDYIILDNKHYGKIYNDDIGIKYFLIKNNGVELVENQKLIESKEDVKRQLNDSKIKSNECYNDFDNKCDCINTYKINSKIKIENQSNKIYLLDVNKQIISDLSKKIDFKSEINEFYYSTVNDLILLTIINKLNKKVEVCYIINLKGDVIKSMNISTDNILQYECHDSIQTEEIYKILNK
jgi:hypothetical protein